LGSQLREARNASAAVPSPPTVTRCSRPSRRAAPTSAARRAS